ncbi:Nucleoside-diphosphate-sugar epimerase [Chitinophaga sp. CF118]|uniref:NAD-dependent epimerase/dehydratase family protein n=1 Tax=Chitinophaga sp. CF118 TaxID=1884367 RepID=UPI0008EA8107|nr:NAD-dependent epimerase/dehydratase family protein [Chitinophaga sp. CF118]SFF02941.1 Nucleoside-diphosphate-sugar epimerase [Chitinophaga sp. CF118]
MTIKKVFLTGANGYIGGTIAHLLVKKGYEVAGLIRKPELAAALEAQGVRAVIGSIDNATLLKKEALAADAVIHTASTADTFPIDTFIDALKGTGKTLIHTSGSSILGKKDKGEKSGFIHTEDFPLDPVLERVSWVGLNNHVLRSATEGIRSIVIVPTMIYGEGLGLHKESIQIPYLWKLSKEKGIGIHIEKGESIWSNVHVVDTAQLYVDVLEKATAGSLFYVENGQASFKEIAQAISKKLGKGNTAASISMDEAVAYWGPEMANFGLGANSRCSANKARAMVGWQPIYNSIFEYI